MTHASQIHGQIGRSEEITARSDLSSAASAQGDEELVKLTLENQSFFSFLIKRYEKKLTRYIVRISGSSPEDAEDILQDVFIKAYRNLYGFDQNLKFSSWIYRIAHNQVISHYRRGLARPQTEPLDLDDRTIRRLASDMDIKAETDNKILRGNIDRILSKLDMKYREVLILKFLEDKDYQAISDITEKPIGTIATLINRGKQKFREEMEKQEIKF
jgi:RNA polymerase sigma-70 factor, ECF subfamily